jgi:hypothetical protein
MNIIIFSKGAGNQQYGLGLDAKLLMNALKDVVKNANIKHCDPYTFVGKGKLPQISDVHIYLEIPCRVAYPWAKVNVVIPNQEWWYKNEWSWVFEEPSSYFFYRTHYAESRFKELVKPGCGSYISWYYPCAEVSTPLKNKKLQALFMVGGSVNKIAAARDLINFWQPSYPPLIVVTASDISGCVFKQDNVNIKIGHISENEKRQLQDESLYHVCASVAEGFGYVMAEALSYGSIPIWPDIPVYNELWTPLLNNLGKITTYEDLDDTMNLIMNDVPRKFTVDSLNTCMEFLLTFDVNNFAPAIPLFAT